MTRRHRDTLIDPTLRTWRPTTAPVEAEAPRLDWDSSTWRSTSESCAPRASHDLTVPMPVLRP